MTSRARGATPPPEQLLLSRRRFCYCCTTQATTHTPKALSTRSTSSQPQQSCGRDSAGLTIDAAFKSTSPVLTSGTGHAQPATSRESTARPVNSAAPAPPNLLAGLAAGGEGRVPSVSCPGLRCCCDAPAAAVRRAADRPAAQGSYTSLECLAHSPRFLQENLDFLHQGGKCKIFARDVTATSLANTSHACSFE